MYTVDVSFKTSSNKLIGCYSPPSQSGKTVSPAAVLDFVFGEIAWAPPKSDTEGVQAKRKAVLS